MELLDGDIEKIKRDLASHGVTMDKLSDSLLDHICCAIEEMDANDFESAYEQVLDRFGDDGIRSVQEETTHLIYKKEFTMKKTMYVLGYFASMFAVTGVLCKMMHWPGGGPALLLSGLLLNFGFLPLYFRDKYKQSVSR
jgi:hypothetical protein